MKFKFLCGLLFFIVLFIIIGLCLINKRETIAIIGAMKVEITEVEKNLSCKKYADLNNFKIITGILGKYRIILSDSGVGKVASSTTTQFIIDRFKPKYIINIGLAGSLKPELKTGDTIIFTKMVQHDFDVTAFGNPKGYIDNGIEPNKPTIFYSDKFLINKFLKTDSSLKLGTIATGDIFVTDSKLKNSIRNDFDADAIDMESAAIAQTAKRNNVPVIIIKTISDGLSDDTVEYNRNKQNLVKKPARIIINLLKNN